jgi:lysophospholipase L1-like esterase
MKRGNSMKRILFQGDSITDADRARADDKYIGRGYPLLVKAQLGVEHNGEYDFINKGISGNRVIDLYARIKKDIINLAPDYISILIGVNDVWHGIDWANGTGYERFYKVYSMLVAELKAELPNIKIMILEPFVLKGYATANREDQPERFKIFREGVLEMARLAKRVAEENGIKFVPLQEKFDEAAKTAPDTYWLGDGVHPTAMGHELIKREWLKAFGEIK